VLRAEATELLRRLIACDTSNPPGREAQAAAVVEDYARVLLMADEENGSAAVGAPYFVEAKPDLCPDFVVGEGAGERCDTTTVPRTCSTTALWLQRLPRLREAYGSTAYGWIPFRHADALVNLETKRGADERVLIDDLAFQVQAARFIARAIGGGRSTSAE
jgi:hypothetical protein